MTVDEIKELIQVVNESGIAELEVQRGENRVRIRRSTSPVQEYAAAPSAPVAAPLAAHVAHGAAPATHGSPTPNTPAAPAIEVESAYVKSPIVGTFYESGSPGAAPFVKVGDRVTPGQVLCIIESMKLMNEIECEISGTIVAKLVENGRPVEYGESLFAVQPS
ncbi:MAG TPA: acetyl-CoA carboxylase biotin carboxyl carrier protein [Bryobacteraceae bacterium]|nr:acetyl-CoA carboxylase biotin carboxyl carrier protein [Bryobacteraceae bacterium]